jgi:hypothetical protein
LPYYGNDSFPDNKSLHPQILLIDQIKYHIHRKLVPNIIVQWLVLLYHIP